MTKAFWIVCNACGSTDCSMQPYSESGWDDGGELYCFTCGASVTDSDERLLKPKDRDESELAKRQMEFHYPVRPFNKPPYKPLVVWRREPNGQIAADEPLTPEQIAAHGLPPQPPTGFTQADESVPGVGSSQSWQSPALADWINKTTGGH